MFINVETQEWPISEHAIRTSNLNTRFTEEFVPPYPFMQVKATIPSETFNRVTHTIEQSTPECVDGEYFQTWKVVPKYKTKEEEDEAILDNLNDTKSAKNLEINTERLKANNSWFVFLDSRIACDQLSKNDIKVSMGMLQALAAYQMSGLVAGSAWITGMFRLSMLICGKCSTRRW